MAEEKHCLADKDFAEGVKEAMANLNAEGNYFDIGQLGDNLVYALLRQAPEDQEKGTLTPFAFAEYRHPDGTVQKFRIIAGADAAKAVDQSSKTILD